MCFWNRLFQKHPKLGQFWNSLFQKYGVGVFSVKLPHPPDVISRQSAHVWKLVAEVGGDLFDDGIAPFGCALFFDDGFSDVPVEQD